MFLRFLMCSPKVLPITSHFHPTCFVQSPPLLTYIGGPRGEALYSFNFFFCDGPIKLAHRKKTKVGLLRTGAGAAMARQSRGAKLWSLSQVRQRSRRSRSRSSEGATTKRSEALKSVLQYGRGHSLHFWVSLSTSTAEVRAYILVS
jgi:hypothetical protein